MVFLTKLFGEKLELSLVLMLQRNVKLHDFFFPWVKNGLEIQYYPQNLQIKLTSISL